MAAALLTRRLRTTSSLPSLAQRVEPYPERIFNHHQSYYPYAGLAAFHSSSLLPRKAADGPNAAEPSASNPRAIDQLRLRIGHCIRFGLTPRQTADAGLVLQEIAINWRDLLAGSEGFLTGPDRRGLYRQRVVWGEMDIMGHVNNVAYNRYAESARVNWAWQYARHIDPEHAREWSELCTPRGDGLILRSIRTDYKFPMTYPDCVTVYHKLHALPEPGDDSFWLDAIILSEKHRRVAARCLEDEVLYDYRAGRKLRLDARPFVLRALRKTWELQQEAATLNRMKVDMLSSRVRALELDSWDRPDAKEDMGSSSPATD